MPAKAKSLEEAISPIEAGSVHVTDLDEVKLFMETEIARKWK